MNGEPTANGIVEIADIADFEASVLGAEVPVVVDFFADWCGPCAAIEPVFERLAERHGEAVRFVRVDTERAQDVAAAMHIRSLPTIALVWRGQIRDVLVGLRTEKQIESRIEWLRDMAEGRSLLARLVRRRRAR
jgi:thioredoxin